MKKRIVAGILASGLVVGTGVAFAGETEKKNDVILRDRRTNAAPDYIEVFKKEGTNGKNYLYSR